MTIQKKSKNNNINNDINIFTNGNNSSTFMLKTKESDPLTYLWRKLLKKIPKNFNIYDTNKFIDIGNILKIK